MNVLDLKINFMYSKKLFSKRNVTEFLTPVKVIVQLGLDDIRDPSTTDVPSPNL